MKKKPEHAPSAYFNIVGNQLMVGDIPAGVLATQVGQTPFYAYDRSAITARVETLRARLPDEIGIHYAMKANPMPALVAHIATHVDGFDIASHGEMTVALDAGVDPAEISFAGPGKSDRELAAAVAAGITVNLESEGEARRIHEIGERLGIRPRVAVRVNPDFELKASGMKMAGGAKPFGVDAERVPALLEWIGERDLHFRGFHIFSGSQNLKPEALIEANNQTFDLAIRLAASAPSPVEWLNIGGGYGIPYFPGEKPLDLQPIADNLDARLPGVREALPEVEVVIELGRYLVGEAGVYLCEVIDKKVSRGKTFLVTNGGLHHHLAASGNFGQVIRKNYPVIHATNARGEPRETVSVVGPLCTPLDILADNVELPPAEPGDLIAVMQSGAYGFSASPHRFLSQPLPVEVLV